MEEKKRGWNNHLIFILYVRIACWHEKKKNLIILHVDIIITYIHGHLYI